MRSNRKNPEADLRNYYTLFFQGSLVVILLVCIAAVKMDLGGAQKTVDMVTEQEITKMEEVIQTKQEEEPPPPPRPQVPVEVPNDEIIEEQNINLDAEISMDDPLEMPPPPQGKENEENFFVAVEQMPQLKGGLRSLHKCVEYPKKARMAGIEGRVVVQFIVNEAGKVEENNINIVRGIGAGANKEAMRCVKQAEFEPGRQRGKTVRVQFSLPVVFNLTSGTS